MFQTDNVVSYPLTIPQKEIWFSQMLAPDSFEYNIGGDCPLHGVIHPERLEQAVNHVVKTVDALRLRFFIDENLVPRQYVSTDCESGFAFIDLSDSSDPERETERILTETLREPFRLTEDPLFRFKLIKKADREFVYVFFFHHLITDGWSISLINNLIAENYNLSLDNQPSTGEQDSYLTFIEEDRNYRESDRYAKQKAFWLKKLEKVPELPFRAKYLSVENEKKLGGFHSIRFKRSTCDRLETVAKQADSTPFPAFLALFYAHLHLIERAEGCLIGFPTLNRTGKFKRTPGLFTGVSIGYLDFGTQISFLQLIEEIGSELKQNYRHIRFPISEVSRASKNRDHPNDRLFDLTISYEKHPHLYHFGDASGRGGAFGERPQKIPLDIHIRDYDPDKDLIIEFNYGRDYFDAKDIETFTDQLEWLTEQFLAHPEILLDQTPLVSPKEEAILESWNKPAFALPADTTVIDLFETQVSKNPGQPAIIIGEETLNYEELNHQANRIAHLLHQRGIGEGAIVGICMEKRPELYASILAILKAGAAYLPIDPGSPDDRIQYILEDASCACFVTSGAIRPRVSYDPEKEIDIDSLAGELASLPESNLALPVKQESLAYIIYTSGSTGNPKGVMVEHRSLLNAILSYYQSWEPTPEDRGMQQASIAFDVSVCELFSLLGIGGTILVPEKETILDPQNLATFVAEHQITFIGATPSLLNNLQQIGCRIPCVRKIFSGGESLNFSHIEQFLPYAQVVNGYGPTEATIGATAHIVTDADAKRIRIPIGKPLPNYEIYMLDDKLRPLPLGTPGELCIGGAGLARGYLNRPELTAEKFVECEIFGVRKRLYRTGDLARWLSDGSIEFLGRLDHQIKLRGYRIELGEIESILASHPAIREAVVALQNPESAQAQLVGYYITKHEHPTPDKAELLAFLSQTLPPYMVPTALIPVEYFPTTTSGKVDRRALPQPMLQDEPEQRAPETETEKELVSIWNEVLGVEIESTNVNFFELGGHSLLSTQVISKVRDRFGVDLPFQVFFEKALLHQQAQWIERTRLSTEMVEGPNIIPTDHLEPSLAQLRLLFLAQLDDNKTLYDMYAALECRGVLDDEALEKSLCRLVEHHDSLRSAFPSSGSGPRLILLDPFNPLTKTDIRHLPSDQKTVRLKELCDEERDRPLDLEKGPLIRFHRIRLEEDLRVLCLKIHHTISDGWSTGVLFRDWSRFYESYREGREPTDAKPQLQYPDFASWQKKWVASPAFEKQLDYWKKQLRGLPERIELPTDFPRPQKLRYRGSHYRSQLPRELTTEVKSFGKARNITEFMTLLAAFEVLLWRYSGQDDFAVGSPIANRNLSQTEEMIGLFVNTLVLRARINPALSFADLIEDTRQTTLQAFRHQDLPLETLVEAINPERNLSHAPLFQVLFVHQPASGSNLIFEGVETRFLPPDYEVAKFDLTLSVFEDNGEFICEWEYDTDLYTRPTIERMSSHFGNLLEGLLAHPEKPVSTFDFLSEEERNQLASLRIEEGDLPDIRIIFSGGEAADWDNIRQLLDIARGEDGYGSTEASTSATTCTLRKDDENRHFLSIGNPLPNYRIFILDRNHLPQPIGVPGELCIAGIGLARPPHNPKLTEENFVEIQIFDEKVKIYKTDDLARWLPDGNIEFLGRIDNQVKLRGFRVELGEIENAILNVDIVREAIVVVHNHKGIEQLVAYVVLNQPIEDAAGDIKTILEEELPGYMCPKRILIVPQFPLTSNGNIDRKALPEPDFGNAQITHLSPKTEQELRLREIWSELFRRPIQAVNLDFFEAGGHSLLAMQLVSRIRETFDIDIPLRVLFEHTDIRSQAAWIKANQTETRLPEILPQEDGTQRELSYAQHRLWFIEKLNGKSDSYNICTLIHLKGHLDLSALERSFTSIIARHETLRSRFIEVEGQPTVQIAPEFNPLTVVSEQMDHQNLDDYLKAFSKEPFDLTEDPLFVVHLVPLSYDEHALLIKMHHIVSDGWSLELLSNEMNHFYNAYAQHTAPAIAPLRIQYGDFAREQKKWLEGPLLNRQLEYWKQQLKGIPERLDLPADFRQSEQMSTRGSYYQQELSPELSESIQAFSLEQGATRFMTLLAAFDILLARYSNMKDIVVGSPVANRNRKETEDLIGFFVNNLVLRNRIDGREAFTEILQQVRKTTLEAYTHQDVPFERIVEAVNPQRNLGHAPLFQVVFTFRNQSSDPLQLHNLDIRYLIPETNEIAVKNDLSLEVYEAEGKLVCVWAYCTDLFRQNSIHRMADNFVKLLQGLMSFPGESIARISMQTELDEQLIQKWNRTDKDYALDKTVIALIGEQAVTRPQHIALEFGEGKLTYLELEEESNRIAHYLRKQGVSRETPVTVCMDRSLEYVVFIVAILKAEGAFVPIDPAFPPARIQYVVEDSGAPILITQAHLTTALPPLEEITVLTAEELEPICNSYPTTPPDTQPDPNALAYIIYTSGSTGNPKGVLIEHKSLMNLVFAKNELFDIKPSDRYLQQASYAFDFSVMNTFVTLCHGATLCTPDKTTLLDPERFKQYLIDKRITVSGTTPSFSANLHYTKAELPDLRLIIFGGEAFQLGHHEQTLGEIRIVNAYGPTEVTVAATMHEVTRQDIHRKVPIGKPIANYRVHMLDENLQPLPVGVPGELCVEGVGLARGYLNRPELTAGKFVHTRIFGKDVRLYRTGDLARWLPEGNIEFLGRIDNQVKFRGYRFELEEVETVLSKMDAINEAVVDIRETVAGQTLVAFVYLNEPIPDLTKTLRTSLKALLPDYMIPTFFVKIKELPLSHTGKVDRKALRAHNFQELLPSTDGAGPQNPTEKKLAHIWQSLLGVEKLSLHDNFFDLGGHSLLAPKLISKISQEFESAFSLKDLFQFPTLQQQAVLLDKPTSHLQNSPAESGIDFTRESILPSAIRPQRKITPEQIEHPQEILLTGATGFLGTWLLNELLHQTDAKIHCLVRGGAGRIQEALRKHQLWQDSFDTRISILIGDLESPRLGLDESTYHSLCENVDAIYHNGAWVNHTYPYEALQSANVGSTLELLKMSSTGRAKAFHFVSTFSAISNAEEKGADPEQILKMLAESNHGYAQSKWVSEQLVKEAGNRGLQATIYRPRRISGHSITGDYNRDDFISLLLKGCAQMGKYPILSDSIRENLIPVDYVCKVLVRSSLIPHSGVQIINLLNSHSIPWNRLFAKLREVTSVDATDYNEWRDNLIDSPDNALYPFLSVFPPTLHEPDVEQTDELERDLSNRTREKLSGEGINIPPISENLLDVYFQKFQTTKYFDFPV